MHVGAHEQVVEVEVGRVGHVGADAADPGGEVDHQVGPGVGEQAGDVVGPAQVVVGRAGCDERARPPAGAAARSTARPRKPLPAGDQHRAVGPGRRRAGRSGTTGERTGRPPRAGCALGRTAAWSVYLRAPARARMPGHACRGRPRAVLAPRARAAPPTAALDQVAAVAAHRARRPGRRGRPPPRAAAAEPCRPPIPVRHLPLPAPALYATWHRLRVARRSSGPPARSTSSTPPATPSRPRTAPARRHPPRPGLAARPVACSPANGVRFFEAGLRAARCDDADLVLCPSQATLDGLRRPPASTPTRLRLVPWGIDHGRRRPTPTVDGVRAALRPRPAATCCRSGTLEPRKNLPAPARGVRPPARSATSRSWSSAPTGWGDVARRPRSTRLGDAAPVHRASSPERQLGPLYGGAAVFCYPSLREGFGLPVLEAMGAGAPVVTSAGTADRGAGGRRARAWRSTRYDVDAIAGGARRRCSTTTTWPTACGRPGGSGPPSTTWAGTAAATIAAYRGGAAGRCRVGVQPAVAGARERRRQRGRRPSPLLREIAERRRPTTSS